MGKPSVGLLARLLRGRTILLLAAALFGPEHPSLAQNPTSPDGSFVGLPPAGALTGPVRRMPDGSVGASPQSSTPIVPPTPVPASVPPTTPAPLQTRVLKPAATGPSKPAATPGPLPPHTAVLTANDAPPEGQPTSRGPAVISQIHNAPGWRQSQGYTFGTGPFTRVVNGPGWNKANGSYDPGLSLNAYQLISAGACISASSGNGPTGMAASIQDGTCVWKYISPVDYISITGWAFDNQPWKIGTLYHYLDYVTSDSPLRAYALLDESCTSSVAPTGTSTAKDKAIVLSDGCRWQYQADILYSSKKSYIPTETFTGSKSAATLGVTADYEAQLWNDREYVAGQNGEASPIRTQNHNDYMHEAGIILGCTNSPCHHVIIRAAPGESFADSTKPSDPLVGYDPTKGVAIRNSSPLTWPYEPAGIDTHDNFTDLIGLQIDSVHGAAVNGMSSFGNTILIRDCILVGGSNDQWTSHAAVTVDTSSVIANSLIVSHGPLGIVFKYPGFLVHSTVVGPDHIANSVGVETFNRWVYFDTMVSNTAIFGFTHAVSHAEVNTAWSTQSSNNLTDAPKGDAGEGPWPYGSSGTSPVDVLPGTTYGASMPGAFVDLRHDWRPKPASQLIGAGSAIGTVEVGCQQLLQPSCAQLMKYNVDSPDIKGTPRPQAGRYDIGAWQSPAAR
jgi:hypothetical protein